MAEPLPLSEKQQGRQGSTLTKSVIGTSSSSSTEAWLVHPEPDIWLALSASTTTTTTGPAGVSRGEAASAAPGEEEPTGGEEDEASGAGDGKEEVAVAVVAPSRAIKRDFGLTGLAQIHGAVKTKPPPPEDKAQSLATERAAELAAPNSAG
ncbi:hypothetical protein NHX12_034048 [Muraenolepis orangiensis]|uniref:Uncharacterized protein n=1 Tax=Muraenolepis orangiensis TaxID=630683 RepID=A0A9Q0E558_9TELE|nr:hypothetical protein NHX12_034048 [Muraenolepis orangiensis]